ncbi:MAG: hypothetical protein IJ660_02885 [Alphaproteobacteria bacterium]|nr:hypothetical protein [Alphaproteobacteria bacterium]
MRKKSKNNQLIGVPAYWKNADIYLKGGNNTVKLGKNIFMHNTKIKLFGSATLELDDGVYMEGCTFMIKDSHVHIGRNTEMMKVGIYAYGKSHLDIGANSTLTGEYDLKDGAEVTAQKLWCTWPPLVAAKGGKITMGDCGLADTVIYNTDYHPIYDYSGKRINEDKDVVIEDNVWVGRKTTVLKGVHLGNGCILGFGCIVSKDVPPHCIVAGQPARVVKENVVWDISEEICPKELFPLKDNADADAFFKYSRGRGMQELIREHKNTWMPYNYFRAWWAVARSK